MDGEEPTDGGETLCDGGEDEPDSGRRCVNCGAPLNRYSQFCSECGTEQDPDAGTGRDEREWQQGGQDGRGSQPGTGRQSGGGGQSGGQLGTRREPGGGQQRSSGPKGRPGGRQQQGGQQYGRQPDRLQTAGPDSSTGLAAITHVLALFTGLIGPILIYAIADDPFVRENAANATNWQIMLIVYSFATFILIFVFAVVFELFAFLAVLVFMLLFPLNLIFVLIGAVKGINGEAWDYPITPDLL